MAAPGDFVAVELQQVPAPKGGAGAVTESSAAACGLLTWRGVTVTVSDKAGHSRDIVSHATGVAPPGELLAIMGPSGCGKSTLLDSLAGRLKGSARLQGDVRVNGHAASLAYGRSAYVTQDEVLIGTLTVRETLTYAARLRLAGGDAHARRVADAVVADLGLTDAADTLIGTWHVRGVSGGQRRRVAVGCELVISPSLLFLDEPTSGLDAAAAYHVAAVLKRLCAPGGGTSGSTTGPSTAAATAAAGGGGCAAGRTIVAVIHQPSSEMFELLDGLCLMAAGKTVYFGPAAQVDGFFAAAGFATPRGRSVSDHTLHTVNADFGDAKAVAHNVEALLAAYAASPQRAAVHARIAEATAHPGPEFTARAKPPPAAKQVLVLTQRALTNNWRDPGIFWVRVVMYFALCLVAGFVYWRTGKAWRDVYSRTALLFYSAAFLVFMSVSGAPGFTETMKVFTRERLNGYYSNLTFTLADTLASTPFIALIALLSSNAMYWIANLNYHGFDRFVYFALQLFATLLAAEAYIMMLAPLVSHFLMLIAIGAASFGFMMTVGGFFQPRSQLPRPILLYPLHYISFETYTFFGFLQNEFADTDGWGCPCSAQPGGCPPALGGAACRLSGADVLRYWDVPLTWRRWRLLGVMFGWAVAFRCIFFLTTTLKERRAR